MINDVLMTQEYVSVALALDDRSRNLAYYAADVADKLGKKLCFIHAVEPWVSQPFVQPFGVPSAIWQELPAIQDAAMTAAEAKLRDISVWLETKGKATNIRIEVGAGSPVDVIQNVATRVGTCLLVTGGTYRDVKFFPAGLHTSLALASTASCPVMIADPKANQTPVSFDGLRLLIADDLEPKTDAAVAYAASIAQAYRGTWVYHLHVSALNREFLSFGLQSAASAARTLIAPAEIDRIADAVADGERQRLEERFSRFREYLEAAGGHYTSDVVSGTAKNQLSWVTAEFEPDILVFGRHKSVHHKPFSLGRMPYREMLRLKRPMIVVPSF